MKLKDILPNVQQKSMFFVVGAFFFSEMCCPRTPGKRTPKLEKRPNCLDIIDGATVLHTSICKFNAKNTPDAFKHVPDLF